MSSTQNSAEEDAQNDGPASSHHDATSAEPRDMRHFAYPLIAVAVAAACWLFFEGNSDQPPPNEPAASPAVGPGTITTTIGQATSGGSGASSAQPWDDIDNPANDGWETEVFNSVAGKQLKQLGELFTHSEKINVDTVEPLVAKEVTSGPLLPPNLQVAYEDKVYRVERIAEAQSLETPGAFVGTSGLTEAFGQLAALFAEAKDVRFKFKIFQVDAEQPEVVTRQYFAISGQTTDGILQHNATWDIRWKGGLEGDAPQIAQIAVIDFEQVVSHHEAGPLFADCTEAVLGDVDCWKPQILRGVNHWLQHGRRGRYFFGLGTPAIAMGDVNGDGLDDLYLCQEDGLPNRLFLQQTDGTVEEVAAEWGVDWIDLSRGALLIDWDNDGDQDLAVATLGGLVLAENDQQQKFVFRTILPTNEDTTSIAAADYDLDGDLDIYVCSYYRQKEVDKGRTMALPAGAANFVYHDANDGGWNSFFRNDGDGQFSEATKEVGFDKFNFRYSFGATWEDYDNDGDPDLYVVNDYGRDSFYRNDGATFVDISDGAKVEDSGFGMGATWGDFDRDGMIDIHISNMWSSAGNRIAYQSKFMAESPEHVKRRLQRLARGNTLLKNRGDGVFSDVSAKTGIEMGRWAWSSNFVDINNDGWQDLVVANGFVTTPDPGDL